MKTEIKFKNNISLIRLNGKLNIETIIVFDEIMNNVLKNETVEIIAIDCKNLQYIDSSGLGSWIQFLNTTKSLNKEFYLFDVQPNILIIIEMAFLEKYFKCTTSEKLNTELKTDFFKTSE
jgi:anti-sigma B factor antagonist